MKYRQLGDSEASVSAVVLGGAWDHAELEAAAIATVREAIDLGITAFDTAATYGLGKSEETLGKALAGRREKAQILTKFGQRWDRPEGTFSYETVGRDGKNVTIMRNGRPESVIEECEQCLRRLRTDYIDLFQYHWPDPQTPIAETIGAVARLIEQGKVLAGGVSNCGVDLMTEALETGALATTQSLYSLLDRQIETDILPWAISNNVSVLPYSPLHRGLLTGRIRPGYTFRAGDDRPDHPDFQPDNLRRVNAILDDIRPIADAHGATITQLVLNWTMHRPGVAAVVCGASSREQVVANAHAADFTLAEDETRTIDERFASGAA